jgi:hypothetical protein
VVLACLVVAGCRDDPVAPPLPPDEKVLRALDYYEPAYKVDADGRVTHLRLTWRNLPPPVMAEVNKLTELHALDLYGADVTDEGLGQIKDLQNLRQMGLGGTPITDRGLVHLQKLQSLQFVWLPKDSVTQAGVEALKQARPDLNVYLQ